ncbi:ABC transporter permease [Leucobacter rhizosphaerae]|uniref:ABC transporter permease n=1 Tax=Leucobacter rhizosphaerae TaxID=2932245 RepID=A0ABY4FUD6_9MICO|nr:ABC transporter permease [Leucobacter rhizosphaerae]UOQ59851.1 ABC transporter permease [Leucobacter rhizosphaerae]
MAEKRLSAGTTTGIITLLNRPRGVTAIGGWVLIAPAVIFVAVCFIVPLTSLIARSFVEPTPGFGQYVAVLGDATTMRILGRTFSVAFQVTLVTLILGYPYAYLMTLVSTRTRTILMFLVLLPFWSSLMARTFAWIALFHPEGVVLSALRVVGLHEVELLGTQLGVTIAMVQVLLPFMVLPLYSTMSGIDRRLLDAASSLGASKLRAFVRVYAPLSLPGVFAGSVLLFIMSLGFWVTPRLIGSPQESLVGQLIETRVGKLLDFAGAGAISTVLLVITVLLLLISAGAMRRASRPISGGAR